VLHYLNSPCRQKTLCLIFGAPPAVISKYLSEGMAQLSVALSKCHEARIKWPKSNEEYDHLCGLMTKREPNIHDVFGVVDGLSLPKKSPKDADVQNAYYNGWSSGVRVSNVVAWGSDGCIIAASYNCPGSWHDAAIARPIYSALRSTPSGRGLIADTAFPRSGDMAARIRTGLKEGDLDKATSRGEQRRMLAYHRVVTSLRQAAEWGMRFIQGSFARLYLPLPVENDKCELLLRVVLLLCNYRTRTVGFNQIATVFNPVWQPSIQDASYDRIAEYYRIT